MKRVFARTVVFLLAFMFVFAVSTQVQAKVKVKSVAVKSITGDKSVVYVAKGKKVKLTTIVKVSPNTAKNKKVSYKSMKKKIASVSSTGSIKGNKLGTTKVTVQSKKNKKKKATIKVKVVNPVNKVTLNCANSTLKVGGSQKLVAKVTGKKGFCKTVRWVSSNSKVVVVSGKGVIQAKGVGTAVITVMSVDGTGKKATCKVSVEAEGQAVNPNPPAPTTPPTTPAPTTAPTIAPTTTPTTAPTTTPTTTPTTQDKVLTSITSATFRNGNLFSTDYSYATDTIFVSLNQPKALSEEDFEVEFKSSVNSKFNQSISVDSVFTENNKDYIISVRNPICSGFCVQVTIDALDGTKSIDKVYAAGDQFVRQGVYLKKEAYAQISLDLYFDKYFEIIDVSGNLPSGMSINEKQKLIYGVPDKITDQDKYVVTAVNQFGQVKKYEFIFMVGDEKNIVSVPKICGESDDDFICDTSGFSEMIYSYGGSGSYEYSLQDDCGKVFAFNSQTPNCLESVSGKLIPGVYKPVILIKDKNDDSITKTVEWKITVLPSADVTVKVSNFTDTTSQIIFERTTGDVKEMFIIGKNSPDGSVTKTIPTGKYDAYYTSITSTGETKRNYLAKDVDITGDEEFTFTVKKMPSITCKFTYSDKVKSVLFSADGDYVSTKSTNNSVSFKNQEPGKYLIKFYDDTTKQYLGETEVFTLEDDVTLNAVFTK